MTTIAILGVVGNLAWISAYLAALVGQRRALMREERAAWRLGVAIRALRACDDYLPATARFLIRNILLNIG